MLAAQGSPPQNPIDLSIKMLLRGRPEVALSLAGLTFEPQKILFEDTAIQTHEYRADHVLILEKPRIAFYWEYQLVPKAEVVVRWFEKCAALTSKLGMPVILMVIYLEKGNYATFHDRHEASHGSARTLFQFTTIKLWEHVERIRSGELIELVPFLFLCDNKYKEETVLEEIDLIYRANLPETDQAELYQAVFRVAGSRLSSEIIDKLYREKESMIKENFEYDVLRELLIEEGIGIGEERGVQKGIGIGEERGALKIARKLITNRLGEMPTYVESYLQSASESELTQILESLHKTESYDELKLRP